MIKGKPILSYPEFDRLIPKARWTNESIKRKAELEDTLEFLPDGVEKCKWQVAKIVPLLKGKDIEETCYNIWYHLYTGIKYNEDEKGKEQIKSPRRSWWGREADCDDFSVFVSCILCNMEIPHLFRIAKYSEKGGYQHIYVVALKPDGTEIIIDCVLNRFNRQVPFIEKIDKKMELQFLDGIGDEYQNINGIDADDLLRGNLGQLGKKGGFFKAIKKGLHALNKLNPATLLLRAGILLCMKMNILKVGSNLRYTYLTDDQAKAMKIDMSKLAKMKKVREKLEKIFYGAGGEEKNLKKAILKGKGNHDKAVPLSGLGSVDMNEYTSMHSPAEILGAEIYNSELAGFEEMGSLGIEPTSDSAIAVAMTAISTLAVIIKKIGSLKPKGGSSSGGAADGSGTATPDSSDTSTPASTDNSSGATTPTDGGANTDTPATATGTASGDGSQVAGSNNKAKATTDPNADTSDTADATKDTSGGTPPATQKATPAPTGIMEWAKANKPAAIGIAAAVIALLSYGAYKLNSHGDAKAVSGVPKKKSKKGTNGNEKLGKIKIQKLR